MATTTSIPVTPTDSPARLRGMLQDIITRLNNISTTTVGVAGSPLIVEGTLVELNSDQPICDSSANEYISFTKTASAVNQLNVTNAATATSPRLSTAGDDTNIGLTLASKGTGAITLNSGASTLQLPVSNPTTYTQPLVFTTAGVGSYGTFVQRQTPSGASSIAFTNLDAFRFYIVNFYAITVSSAGCSMRGRYSTDNGATWVTAANYNHERIVGVAGVASAGGVTGETYIEMGGSFPTPANNGSGFIYLYGLNNSSATASADFKHMMYDSAATTRATTGGGYYYVTASCKAFQIYMSAGTFSGTFDLYGVS